MTEIALATPSSLPLRGVRWWCEALRALAIAEMRETGDTGVGGVARWIVEPFSYMIVFFLLVGGILGRPQAAFPLFLLCALVPWRYFFTAVSGAMSLLIRYAEPLKSYPFPREVLPLVQLVVGAAGLLSSLLLFVPMMVLYGIAPTAAWLWLPAVLVGLAVLTAGPTYIAAAFGLYFPDYRGAAQNLLRLGFFISTALAPAEDVSSGPIRSLVRANPLSAVFDAFRDILIAGRPPDAADLLYPLFAGAGLLAAGVAVYRWRQPHFPKEM